MNRVDGRTPEQLREISFVPDIAPHASGSVLVSCGRTRVICSVMIERGVPRWMKEQKVKGGWLTAEYSMLPYSTIGRKPRDISRGKLDGRSSEIMRLIGRSLRAAVDLKKVDGHTVWVDCDVLQADGGTRTASVTGACVALGIAFNRKIAAGVFKESPMVKMVSAISAGIYRDAAILDLNYVEDRDAAVDMNFVIAEGGEFVEMQGTGEEGTFSDEQLTAMLKLGKSGCEELCKKQHEAIRAAEGEVDEDAIKGLADVFGGS
ncbi:MAG: ribonuclease PH [Verrucomicrobiales bacterium]|jgi:ribonuclease PH